MTDSRTLCLFHCTIIIVLAIANGQDHNNQLEYRIQNGFAAVPGEFPSVVLLTGKVHRCTGILISPSKILTAGHCACGDAMTHAFANITDLAERFAPTVQQRRIIYLAYPVTYANSCEKLFNGNDEDQNALGGAEDIAVLTTDVPFVHIPGVVEFEQLPLNEPAPVRLHDTVQSNSMVLGFGREALTETTGFLRFGYIKLTPCPHEISINTAGALCAPVHSNAQIPAVGDSGGPLIEPAGNVIGVTSIAGNGWIVFSSVLKHADFIRDQLL